MKLIRPMLLLVITLLCLGVVAAQQTSHKHAAKKESAKSETSMGMPMPKPSPQIEKLAEKIAGTWNTSEDFEVSEMMPKGPDDKTRQGLRIWIRVYGRTRQSQGSNKRDSIALN